MSNQSHLSRTLVAALAALLTSSVAIAAAVGPADVNLNPIEATLRA